MRTFGKWLGRALMTLVLALGALWIFGPREPVMTSVRFNPDLLGENIDAYLASVEGGFGDITPGVEKRVHWARGTGERTPLSLVYIHGFSATSEEIRPVPDRVAEALGANLHYTRLEGHGRGGAPMGLATVEGWMGDVAEALAVGRAIGDEVVVIATSTGATLATVAATEPDLAEGVKGWILVSPNMGINNPAAPLLTMPAARHLLPPVFGRERSFEPQNEGHRRFWTTRYPTVAVMPMAALVAHARDLDLSGIDAPALVFLSDDDRVVVPAEGRALADRWGGGAEVEALTMGAGDDPSSHVIMGDLISPGQTEAAAARMAEWIEGL